MQRFYPTHVNDTEISFYLSANGVSDGCWEGCGYGVRLRLFGLVPSALFGGPAGGPCKLALLLLEETALSSVEQLFNSLETEFDNGKHTTRCSFLRYH